MSVSTSLTIAEGPPAQLEQAPRLQTLYTDIIYYNTTTNTADDGTVEGYLDQFLEGCGNVDLVELSFKAVTTSAGQYIKIGTAAIGSSQSIDTICMTGNGFSHVSNSSNYGQEICGTLVPMSNISRQLRPASTVLPMMTLQYSKSAPVSLVLCFKLKVNGIRVRWFRDEPGVDGVTDE